MKNRLLKSSPGNGASSADPMRSWKTVSQGSLGPLGDDFNDFEKMQLEFGTVKGILMKSQVSHEF